MKGKNRFLTFVTLISLCLSGFGQTFDCNLTGTGTNSGVSGGFYKANCDGLSPDLSAKYDNVNNPFFQTNNFPIRTISLRFVILQKAGSDPKNFANNMEDINYLQSLVYDVNFMFENMQSNINSDPSCSPYLPQLNDSRIRFSLDAIDFVIDDNGWNCSYNSSGFCQNYQNCPNASHYLITNHGVDLHKSINVFFVEDECFFGAIGDYNGTKYDCFNDFESFADAYNNSIDDANCGKNGSHGCSWFPSKDFSSIDASSVILNNLNARYRYDKYHDCYLNSNVELLAHELGHSMFLIHSEPNGCNNFMTYKGSNKMILENQLPRMNRSLSTYTTSKYVKDCNISQTPHIVSNNELLDFVILPKKWTSG